MHCPRCEVVELDPYVHKEIEVDRCLNCKGIWLDHHELDELEDQVIKDGSSKGTLAYANRESSLPCPKCHINMTEFNYRANNLAIDRCDNGHGFWLDNGEDKEIKLLLEQRVKDLGRSNKAEKVWEKNKQGGSKGLFGKFKNWLKG
jgi:Zn-finger nucleic acid-binding protein